MSYPAQKIAIIGAGPAGLTLARILQANNIPCAVFEKDPGPAHRVTNGGCLDLHPGSGQAAVEAAGLWDEYQKLVRYSGQAYIIADETGREYVNVKGLDLARPEIDRPHLRAMLLGSLEAGTVRWGHRLERVVEPAASSNNNNNNNNNNDGSGTTLYFAEPKGRVESGFGLVVGADGAWSRVRALLTTIPPFYAGLCGYELWLDDPDAACPDVSALAGDGSHWAFGRDERIVSMQRQSDRRRIQAYAMLRKPEGWLAGNGAGDGSDREAVKRVLLREFAGWAPQYRRVIEAVDGSVVPRSQYMLHVGTRWLHRSGVTLIGDAAHLMTPFAGEGVNAAMYDALDLARRIIASPGNLDKAAREYEVEMFPRATAFQQATWDSLQERFEPDGNEKMAAGFKKLAEELQNGTYVADASKPDALFAKETGSAA